MISTRRDLFKALFGSAVASALISAAPKLQKPEIIQVGVDFITPPAHLSLDEFTAQYVRPAMISMANRLDYRLLGRKAEFIDLDLPMGVEFAHLSKDPTAKIKSVRKVRVYDVVRGFCVDRWDCAVRVM